MNCAECPERIREEEQDGGNCKLLNRWVGRYRVPQDCPKRYLSNDEVL